MEQNEEASNEPEGQASIENTDIEKGSSLRHRNKSKKNALPPPVNIPKEKFKRIDYILIYPNKTEVDYVDKDSSAYKEFKSREKLRDVFEKHLTSEGFDIQRDVIGDNVFVKLHTPFLVLCEEAEESHIEMPLKGHQVYPDEKPSLWGRFKNKYLVTDTEADFISGPFHLERLHLFERSDDPETFFRPAMRSFLTYHILMNMDIRKRKDEEEDPFSKRGLQYMFMKKVYTDGFNLHDESSDDPLLKEDKDAYKAHMGSRFIIQEDEHVSPSHQPTVPNDSRQVLSALWAKKWFKYQPIWKIRNYFGEKIALYFAWTGTLISTLILPTVLGFIIFLYGLIVSIRDSYLKDDNGGGNSNFTTEAPSIAVQVADEIADLVSALQKSFDNEATPYFGLIICLWGTIFLEVWKRKNYTLAYEWDVENFEDSEPDRPEFYGTKTAPNPIVPDELQWIYPIGRKIMKYSVSAVVLLFMVLLVCLCVAVVVLYRVYMTVNYCPDNSTINCLLVSTIVASLLQAVFIMVLGKIYDRMCFKLTDWENHRTQTEYDDALIVKLFAFQFVNSYTSLYYIAFFRGREYPEGIFNLGKEYQDSCGTDGNCMSMLSLQVLVLMIAKPLPKFLKDIILPWVKRLYHNRLKPCLVRNCQCCPCFKKVTPEEKSNVTRKIEDYMERERNKPDVQDFTLMEYNEKVLMYGFLVLFCVAMPLGPLIVMCGILIDIRVDARRLLWWFRRPVAKVAQDIGRWYTILQSLNIIGVITNAFLIAYVSRWGTKYDNDPETQLWIVLGFEHIVFVAKFLLAVLIPNMPERIRLAMHRHLVFLLKYMLAVFIPDIPLRVKLAMKREKYQVSKIIQQAHREGNGPINYRGPTANFGPDMIKPSLSTDLGAAKPPPQPQTEDRGSDKDTYIDEKPRRRHKKKSKKHKKRKEEEGDDMNVSVGSSTVKLTIPPNKDTKGKLSSALPAITISTFSDDQASFTALPDNAVSLDQTANYNNPGLTSEA